MAALAEAEAEEIEKNEESPKVKKVRHMSPKKELDKKKKRVERLESFMQECEEQIAALNGQIESPEVYSDYQKLAEIQTEIDGVREKLSLYEEEWTELMIEVEELEAEVEA